MTVAEATAITLAPPKFGDKRAIDANQFLLDFELIKSIAIRDHWLACASCEATGAIPHCECGECGEDDWVDECPCCDGTGVVFGDDLDRECVPDELAEVSADVVREIAAWLKAKAVRPADRERGDGSRN